MESMIEFLTTMHWGAVFQIILIDMGKSENRTGFGHAVGGKDINTSTQCRLTHGFGQG